MPSKLYSKYLLGCTSSTDCSVHVNQTKQINSHFGKWRYPITFTYYYQDYADNKLERLSFVSRWALSWLFLLLYSGTPFSADSMKVLSMYSYVAKIGNTLPLLSNLYWIERKMCDEKRRVLLHIRKEKLVMIFKLTSVKTL